MKNPEINGWLSYSQYPAWHNGIYSRRVAYREKRKVF